MLLGLEADYAEGHEAALEEILAAHDWDVVLGSVHWVKGDWIDAPGSGARHEREGTEVLWSEYYRLLGKAAATGLFDVLTHFDLPKKFGHRMPPSAGMGRGRGGRGRARGGRRDRGLERGPEEDRRRGVPRAAAPQEPRREPAFPIVFSSDAHAPAEVAWGRAEILKAARAAGAKEHFSFRKRERRRHPL